MHRTTFMGPVVVTSRFRMGTMWTTWSMDIFTTPTAITATTTGRWREPDAPRRADAS
jgi:hypothetical protein